MNDLKQLLATWVPDIPESTGFQRNVWRRIADTETPAKSDFRIWLESLLLAISQPRIALASAAAAIVLGSVLGGSISASGNSGEMAYLKSVNPYAMARNGQ